ncbi:lipoprotein [Actinomadura alba]
MVLTIVLATTLTSVAVAGCGQATDRRIAGPTAGSSTRPGSSDAPRPHETESNPPGDIPDDTQYVAFRSHGYEIKVPEGWARTDLATGASFTDKLNTVRVEVVPAAAAPTPATARAQEVPKIEAAGHNVALQKIETVQRHGGTAVRIRYAADSTPDPVTGKIVRDAVERYEFFSHGQEAVLTLSGPVGADNVDPWRTVSDSFRWAA